MVDHWSHDLSCIYENLSAEVVEFKFESVYPNNKLEVGSRFGGRNAIVMRTIRRDGGKRRRDVDRAELNGREVLRGPHTTKHFKCARCPLSSWAHVTKCS